ncbi:MAG: lipoprotein [Bacteroidales bacterium]|nr:lipoprotein [Bacteroidales bacterium]
MKKILVTVLLLLVVTGCSHILPGDESATGRYELYKTQNYWMFLKLDTQTGMIWQVQSSIKGDSYRFQSVLSSVDLVNDRNYYNGRFSLHATGNMYNYVLLDKSNGRVWQVQWGEDKNRMIVKIR